MTNTYLFVKNNNLNVMNLGMLYFYGTYFDFKLNINIEALITKKYVYNYF